MFTRDANYFQLTVFRRTTWHDRLVDEHLIWTFVVVTTFNAFIFTFVVQF